MYSPEILDLCDLLDTFTLGATAESWAQDGCRRDRFPRYPYICGFSRCSRDVTDITLSQAAESSAAALYPDRPRPTTVLSPRSYGKPDAATAVDKLLMMGMRMPETC
jgi:hypothetical protein